MGSKKNYTSNNESKHSSPKQKNHEQMDHSKMGHDHHIHEESGEHVPHAYHDEQVHPEHQMNHNHHEGHGGHGGYEHHHHGNFKELFLKSLPLGIIVMLLSPMMGVTLPFQFSFSYSDILVAVLATILIIYGGKPFYMGAIDESNICGSRNEFQFGVCVTKRLTLETI